MWAGDRVSGSPHHVLRPLPRRVSASWAVPRTAGHLRYTLRLEGAMETLLAQGETFRQAWAARTSGRESQGGAPLPVAEPGAAAGAGRFPPRWESGYSTPWRGRSAAGGQTDGLRGVFHSCTGTSKCSRAPLRRAGAGGRKGGEEGNARTGHTAASGVWAAAAPRPPARPPPGPLPVQT